MLLVSTSIISEKTSKICLIRNWQQTSKQTYACCNLCALIVGILRLKASKSTPVSASAFRSAKMAKIFRLLLFWVTRGSIFMFRQAAVRSFLAPGSIFPPGASTNHMWASRHLREKRKIRRKSRRERVRRQKTQMREKVGKSRNTVFFQWFVAPEGRKVGSLKRRVRSQLARGEMKNCTPLWREARFEVKMYKTHHGRTTFGSCDVEKVHAVVARSTFRSQNAQNTPWSDHFWKLRCRKSARRCGAKHISKSKCTKHTSLGPLLEVKMSKKCTPLWREAHFEVKMYKALHVRATFGGSDVEKVHAVVARSTFRSENVQNTRGSDHFGGSDVASPLRFTTLHYATLHHTPLYYTTLHYITLHYTPQHYNYNYTTRLHSTTLHYIKLHHTPLHYITLNYAPQHYNYNYVTTLHYTPLHYTKLHYTTPHYPTLHSTTLHSTALHYITLHYLPLHFTTLHYTTLHYTTTTTTQLHSTTRNYTTLHYITLHYNPLNSTTLHDITLHYNTLNDTAPQIDR